MNIASEILKWTFTHPHLAAVLGLAVIGGSTVIAVSVTNNAMNLAHNAIEKGYEFEVGKDTFKLIPNTRAIPA